MTAEAEAPPWDLLQQAHDRLPSQLLWVVSAA
jgi:hypothetical protein